MTPDDDQIASATGALIDGKYLLLDRIGGGGSGLVYRATHVALQTTVAVKLLKRTSGLPPSAAAFARFRAEAEALGRLSHPGIVRVLDFGVAPDGGGTPYLVLDLVAGEPLEVRCRTAGPIRPEVAAGWFTQIADALGHAHANGLVHGDVSARNVLIDGDGTNAKLTIIDFGLAAGFHDASGKAAADGLAGTPEYWAPERLSGEPPTPAADVYAAAVLAWRLFSGRMPFAGDRAALAAAHLTATPAALGLAPRRAGRALDAALRRALAKAPVNRPTLATLGAEVAVAARGLARAAWRRRVWPSKLAAAAALAAVGAVGTAAAALAPPIATLDDTASDRMLRLVTPRTPTARLLLVSLDEPAVGADGRPLSLRGDDIARVLDGAIALGARVVGVDLLLPETWAHADGFRTLLLRVPDGVVLAAAATAGQPVGLESVDPLVVAALGPSRTGALFGLANHPRGRDGLVRVAHWTLGGPIGHATFAGRVAALGRDAASADDRQPRLIDYRVGARRFDRIGWTEFARAVSAAARFDARIVLVGAEFVGSGDRHRVPAPAGEPTEVSGLDLQALAVNTLLPDTPPLRRLSTTATAGIAAAIVFLPAAFATLFAIRPAIALAIPMGLATIWVVAVVPGLSWGVVVPVVAPLAGLLIAVGGGWIVRAARADLPR